MGCQAVTGRIHPSHLQTPIYLSMQTPHMALGRNLNPSLRGVRQLIVPPQETTNEREKETMENSHCIHTSTWLCGGGGAGIQITLIYKDTGNEEGSETNCCL